MADTHKVPQKYMKKYRIEEFTLKQRKTSENVRRNRNVLLEHMDADLKKDNSFLVPN